MSKYWKKRQEEIIKEVDRKDEKVKAVMEKQLLHEYNQIQNEIAKFYAKYGKDNVVSYIEAYKSLTPKEQRDVYEHWHKFLREHPDFKKFKEISEKLYKLTRLDGLKHQILKRLANLNIKYEKLLKEHKRDILNKTFNIYNESVIDMNINKRWAHGYSETLWKNTSKLSSYITDEIVPSIARGETFENISKRMAKAFYWQSKVNIDRIVRTEGTVIINEGIGRAFEVEEDEYITIVTMGDDRVCPICSSKSGERVKWSEREFGSNFPPFHCNCRCTFDIELEDVDTLVKKLRSKH